MVASQIYILISIIVLLVLFVLLLVFRKNKKKQKMTPLTGLAFIFVLYGIIGSSVLNNGRIVAYSLIGIGVLLAVIDMIINSKRK